MNYTVIFHHDLKTLINQVNIAMNQGFRPIGGITTTQEDSVPGSKIFLQAMSK